MNPAFSTGFSRKDLLKKVVSGLTAWTPFMMCWHRLNAKAESVGNKSVSDCASLFLQHVRCSSLLTWFSSVDKHQRMHQRVSLS